MLAVSAKAGQSMHEGNWYVLVAGLPVGQSQLVLAPGLTLSPLAEQLTVFDLAAVGAAGFRQWAVLETMINQCTCELESASDNALIPGYDALNRAWLGSALLALRGHTAQFCVAASAYSWSTVAGYQKRHSPVFHEQLASEGVDAAVFSPKLALPPFTGSLLDYHTKYLATTKPTIERAGCNDAKWVYAMFDKFNLLAAESRAFRYALESVVDWRYATDKRAAIARLWGGIESLFGIKSELVYRLSTCIASTLEPRGSGRVSKFKQIKDLYAMRSKAVHGEEMPDDKVQTTLEYSYELLSNLLLYCVQLGRVPREDDLNSAIME